MDRNIDGPFKLLYQLNNPKGHKSFGVKKKQNNKATVSFSKKEKKKKKENKNQNFVFLHTFYLYINYLNSYL